MTARLGRWVPAVLLLAVACSAGPDKTTKQGQTFQDLWQPFLVIAGLVVLLIWGLVAWCVIRYRDRPGDDGLPNQDGDKPRLELAYTLVPLLLVAVLFTASVIGERDISRLDDDPDLVVDVGGFRWDWQFTYVDAGIRVTGEPGVRPVLRLPVGRTVRFRLHADDVIHSFWVPEFGTKRDLIPGLDNEIDIDIVEAGTWTGRCAEYCGLDHATMDFEVQAMPADEFDAWLDEAAADDGADPAVREVTG
ncbi:MAG: cytochrome c oxidase subunit II [Acidimicrobiales bacterium]